MLINNKEAIRILLAVADNSTIPDDFFLRAVCFLMSLEFNKKTMHLLPTFIDLLPKLASRLQLFSNGRRLLLQLADPLKKALTRQFHGPRLVTKYDDFDITKYTDYEFFRKFRFHRGDIERLRIALRIPDVTYTHVGSVIDGTACLCLLLRRLAFPTRYMDLCESFGGSETHLSAAFNDLCLFLRNEFKTILTLSTRRVPTSRLGRYARRVARCRDGEMVQDCFGFVDSTTRQTCRPGHFQSVSYNPHKHIHGFKSLTLVTPDGMIQHQYGPLEGSMNDSAAYDSSALPRLLQEVAPGFVTYADGGFNSRPQLVIPRPHSSDMSDYDRSLNENMSAVRSSVEWSYRDVASIFKFMQHYQNLKMFTQPVGLYYWVCCLLANCRNCLYGSIASNYFDCQPMSLEDYISTSS